MRRWTVRSIDRRVSARSREELPRTLGWQFDQTIMSDEALELYRWPLSAPWPASHKSSVPIFGEDFIERNLKSLSSSPVSGERESGLREAICANRMFSVLFD